MLRAHSFEVLGRIRYGYSKGIWDEWWVLLDGQFTWLTEDDHELCIQKRVSDHDLQTAYCASLVSGQRAVLLGHEMFVHEVGQAECLGVEGQLPKGVSPGETYNYLNAGTGDGELTLGIEFDDDPPSVFLGEWILQREVRITGEDV